MKINRTDFVKKVLGLNLPDNEYMVFGSGSMFLHGMDRVPNDIDILVTENLYNNLKKDKKFKVSNKRDHDSLELDNIEIFYDFELGGKKKYYSDFSAVKVGEYKVMCVSLDTLIKYKKTKAREKDLRDVELIEEFMCKK